MTDEYTPTTDDVRKTYASGSFTPTGPNTYNIDEEKNAQEFNRWLNEERSKAWREGNDKSHINPYKKKKKTHD